MRKIIFFIFMLLSLLQAVGQSPPPVPALPDAERRTVYGPFSGTCACPVGFALFGSGIDVDSWLEVWVNGVRYLSTDPSFGWSLSSATGSLGAIARPITNAVLNFNQSQTAITVQIVGAERPRRLSQFAENRGVAARDLNQALTDLVAINRELWDKTNDVTGRGLFAPPGNVMGPLPSPANCVGAFLNFGANGLTPTCDLVVVGQFPAGASTVSSNAALKALSVTGVVNGQLAYRAGFTTAGDGGQAFYTFSTSACTLVSGAGDNGMQVKPNSGTGCWIAVPQAQWNILMWGATCSTSVDSSTAVLNAIAALFAQTVPGGTLVFPCIVTMNSALAIPFTGTNPPVQPYLRLTGLSIPWGSALTGIVTPGGAGLNLLYTGGDTIHPAKIDTRGEGILEIDHMIIEDTNTDNFVMLQTTNTTLLSHENHYIGNPACVAPACSQDILQFGGAGSGTGTTDKDATFQGYNTSSINDKFSFCRHAANLNGNANAITFVNVTVDYTCGSAETFGAAFTLSGQAATADANVWFGGIIEMSHYPYAFAFFEASGIHNSSKNQIFGVYVGDPGGGTVAIAYVSANSCSNLIMPSLSASPLLAGPGVACNTGMSYDATNGWQVGTNVTVSFGLTNMGTQSTVGNGTGQGIFNMSGGSSGNGNGAGFFLKSGVNSKGGLGYYSAVLGGATPFNDNIMLFATDRILISGTGTTNCASGLATDAIGLTSCVASAARFKHDIADLSPSDAHRIAMRLTPRSFTYNGDAPLADAGQTAVGFIADEVAEVDPRLVGYDELGRPYVTRPDRILGVIDGTLHWQDGRIRALETQIMVIAFISISAILGFIILGCWWTRRSLGRTT